MSNAVEAESIGREELKALLKAYAHPDEWLDFLKSKKMGTLPQLVSARKGVLRSESAEELDEISTIAAEVKATGGDHIKALSEEDITSVLVQLLQSARIRLPECSKRLHKHAGLQPGDNKKESVVDHEAQWHALTMQRCGAPVPDAERGSKQLLTKLHQGLLSQNRRLAPVDLETDVKSLLAEEGEEEEEEDGQAGKKRRTAGGGLRLEACMVRAQMVFMTLAAAAANELEADGGPKREDGDGLVVSGDSTVTLDASYTDCMTACSFVLLQMVAAKMAGKSPVGAFKQYWDAVTRRVNPTAAGGKKSVSAALACATADYESADGVAKIVIATGKNTSSNSSGERRNRGGVSFADTPKKDAEGGAGKWKGNGWKMPEGEQAKKAVDSTGEVCAQFYRNQKCNYGDACKHRHLKQGEDKKDKSLVDVRKRK